MQRLAVRLGRHGPEPGRSPKTCRSTKNKQSCLLVSRPGGGRAVGTKVFVIGVGMTRFEKPGARDWDYPDMVRESGTKALDDAGIEYEHIEQAIAAYWYGASVSG